MNNYLVPGRPSEAEKNAIRDVAALMEVGDEQREDEELQRQDNAEEDANFDPATGLESPSTLRIIDKWRELRQRGADAADDFYLAETDADEEALAEPTDDQARTARAVESVAQLLNSGIVQYNDAGDEAEAISPEDYPAIDAELRSDFPDDAPPLQEAPRPAPVADRDDNWDGGERNPEPLRASAPPSFDPTG